MIDRLRDDASNAGVCSCGWPLPLSVFAYPNTVTNEGTSNYIKAAHICLVCPNCQEGHSFYDGTEADDGGKRS